MRPNSSTSRSRRAVAALLTWLGLTAVAGPPAVAGARPWLCLPPVFDGGQRLLALPAPRIFWLELLLRQHELCWRSPATAGELRVALFGSSAVYGFPNPVEQTLGERLNRHFAEAGVPARLYNLAFVNPSQVRDAVIIHQALPYEPDVIVYAMTLSEYQHIAPVPFKPVIQFFENNRASVANLAAESPPGLELPIERWREAMERRATAPWPVDALREAGAFLRIAAAANAQWFVRQMHSDRPWVDSRQRTHVTDYDCADIERNLKTNFRNWQDWNVLAYLQYLHETRGIEVLIVSWPVVREPHGDCYNARFTTAAFEDYLAWVAQETKTRHLAYVDLHDLVPTDAFIDSIHLAPDGHRRVADGIARALDPILTALLERRRQGAGSVHQK